MTLAFLIILVTGVVKFLSVYHLLGFSYEFSYSIFGITALTELHDFSGLALILLILIHIRLNWGWVKGVFARLRRIQ